MRRHAVAFALSGSAQLVIAHVHFHSSTTRRVVIKQGMRNEETRNEEMRK